MSQEQEDEAVITDDGQIVPRNSAERMAAEQEAEYEDMEEEHPTVPDGVEDEQEEACVQVRRAPKEPSQEERRRH